MSTHGSRHPGLAAIARARGRGTLALAVAFALAALAVAMLACNDSGRLRLSAGDEPCPIAPKVLGGIWTLDLGAGTAFPVLADCQDPALNGVPVHLVTAESPCLSILPCPGHLAIDTRIVAGPDDTNDQSYLIASTAAQTSNILGAEVRTPACVTSMQLTQAWVNDPYTMQIRCGGVIDIKTMVMDAICQSVTVDGDGHHSDCRIDPPYQGTVALAVDFLFPEAQ